MAQYICINCGQLEVAGERCCEEPDLFPVNDMPAEIRHLRNLVNEGREVEAVLAGRLGVCAILIMLMMGITGGALL